MLGFQLIPGGVRLLAATPTLLCIALGPSQDFLSPLSFNPKENLSKIHTPQGSSQLIMQIPFTPNPTRLKSWAVNLWVLPHSLRKESSFARSSSPFENCTKLHLPLSTVISKLLLGKRLIPRGKGLKPQTGWEASATGPDAKLRTLPLSSCHLT